MPRSSLLILLTTAGCTTGTLQLDAHLSADAAARATTSGAISVGQAADSPLLIDRVLMAVDAVELEGRGDAHEFESDEQLIEISLGEQAAVLSIPEVPIGAYTSLELELMRADGGDFPELGDGAPASIRVSGTYSGEAFDYRSTATPELELDLDARVLPGQSVQVGLSVDVASWFIDADGTILDPLDTASLDTIEANILSSLADIGEIDDDDDDEDDDEDDDDEEQEGEHED